MAENPFVQSQFDSLRRERIRGMLNKALTSGKITDPRDTGEIATIMQQLVEADRLQTSATGKEFQAFAETPEGQRSAPERAARGLAQGVFTGATGGTEIGDLAAPFKASTWQNFGLLPQAAAEAQSGTILRAFENLREGNIAEGTAQGILSGIPVVGPALVGVTEQLAQKAGSGDVAGAIGEALGTPLGMFLGGKATNALTGLFLRVPPPPDVQFLESRGIPLSAGERAGGGTLGALENVSAKSAVADTPLIEFLDRSRGPIQETAASLTDLIRGNAPETLVERALQDRARILQTQLGERRAAAQEGLAGRISQFEGPAGDAPRVAGSAAAATAEGGLKQFLEQQQTAFNNLAETTAQAPRRPRAEVGESLVQAVKEKEAALSAQERQLHAPVQEQFGSVEAPWRPTPLETGEGGTAGFAADVYQQHKAALSRGASDLNPETAAVFRSIASKVDYQTALRDEVANNYWKQDYEKLNPVQRVEVDKGIAELMQRGDAVELENAADPTFSAGVKARTGVLTLARRLALQGESPSTAALGQLAQRMTVDLESALPPEGLAQWRAARETTKANRALFDNKLLRQMLLETKAPAPERIVGTLLQAGNETDTATLMGILRDKPAVKAELRRASIDSILRGRDAQTALNILDNTPSAKAILQETFTDFRAQLEAQAMAETAPTTQNYLRFLKETVRTKDPLKVSASALGSPQQARRLMGLLQNTPEARAGLQRYAIDQVLKKGDPQAALAAITEKQGVREILTPAQFSDLRTALTRQAANRSPLWASYNKWLTDVAGSRGVAEPGKLLDDALQSPIAAKRLRTLAGNDSNLVQQTAADLFQRTLNKATERGTFMEDGAFFNPVKFSEAWRNSRAQMQQFISPETMTQLDQFASGMKRLKLHAVDPTTGTNWGLNRLTGLSGTVIYAMIGSLTGYFTSPVAGAITIGAGTAAAFAPRVFMRAATTPGFAGWLADGVKFFDNPKLPGAAAWVQRGASLIDQSAQAEGVQSTTETPEARLKRFLALAQ